LDRSLNKSVEKDARDDMEDFINEAIAGEDMMG